MKKISVSLLTMITLTGCGNLMWVRPGGTQSESARDEYNCTSSAARLFPAREIQVEVWPSRTTSVQTHCQTDYFGNINCTSTGGDYVPPVMGTRDVNKSARDDAVTMCMKAKGWEYKFISKEDQKKISR